MKASNILLDSDGTVQLCDARDLLDTQAHGVRVHAVHDYSGTAATIPWLAPEILDQVCCVIVYLPSCAVHLHSSGFACESSISCVACGVSRGHLLSVVTEVTCPRDP